MRSVDELDEKIIAILSRDARTSSREVARILGLSDTAVRKRLKRLNATGTGRITTVINPSSLGLTVSALVRMQTAPTHVRSIAEAAAKLSFVSFSALTTGRYNVTTLVLAEDQQALGDLIHTHFRSWKGVQEISTIVLINTAKHRLDVFRLA